MRSAAACVLSLILAVGCDHARPAPTIAMAATEYCVRVECESGVGSGVFVAPNLVLTAWHVVEGAENITVRYKGIDYVAFVLRHRDDLALMEVVTGAGGSGAGFVGLAEAEPKPYDEVFAFGFQFGLPDITATNGMVQCYEGNYLRYSAVGWFGASGGPVLARRNGAWVLVGITQRVYAWRGNPIPHLMLAARLAQIKLFLLEHQTTP